MTGILRRLGNDWVIAVVASLAMMIAVCAETAKPAQTMETQAAAQSIIERVAGHEFHPIRDGFTYDRHLDTHGVADLDDPDWRVRLLAVRDLVRLGPPAGPALIDALAHTNAHVRHVAAMTLGILEMADYGTFWGDRPAIHQLLEMARSGSYDYEAPKRLRPARRR